MMRRSVEDIKQALSELGETIPSSLALQYMGPRMLKESGRSGVQIHSDWRWATDEQLAPLAGYLSGDRSETSEDELARAFRNLRPTRYAPDSRYTPPSMREFLATAFDVINDRLADGRIPRVPVTVSWAPRLGSYGLTDWLPVGTPRSAGIRINERVLRPENIVGFFDTLAHEMAHVWAAWEEKDFAHGEAWVERCELLGAAPELVGPPIHARGLRRRPAKVPAYALAYLKEGIRRDMTMLEIGTWFAEEQVGQPV